MADPQPEEPAPGAGRPADRPRGQRKVPRAVREPHMLEMAGRVFAARGFHEASMDEIAELAGISKPMLYSYFGSKEGLYAAYVDLSYRELISAIDGAVASAAPDVEEQLRAGNLAYYRYVGERRNAFLVLFREMGAPGGELAEHRRRVLRRIARRVMSAFELILLAGEGPPPPPGDIELMAELWIGAARALADWWLDHPEVAVEAVADRLITFGLAGMRASASRPLPGLTRVY